jgi:hypothetical protein
MPDPKRIPVYTMKEQPQQGLETLVKIAALRAKGWGYEDIGAELGIHWKFIRPFVIVKRRT